MFETQIRELRQRAKWTRAELADHAGIGISEMQRIELGIQPARLDAAHRICDALDSSLSELFPAAELILKKIGDPFQTYNLDQRTVERLAKAGLDTDHAPTRLQVQLRGGESLEFVVCGPDRRRVCKVLEKGTKPFVIFDAGPNRIALAVAQATAWIIRAGRYDEPEDAEADLLLYLVNRKDPLTFEVPADNASILDSDSDELIVQLQDIFFNLDSQDFPMLEFEDEVAQHVFIRTRDIVLVRVPLDLVEPSMRRGREE